MQKYSRAVFRNGPAEQSVIQGPSYILYEKSLADIEFRMSYSQRCLFNAIPDTNHNANPTNPNHNSKDNPNTRYCCEYGTLNSIFAKNSIRKHVFVSKSS